MTRRDDPSRQQPMTREDKDAAQRQRLVVGLSPRLEAFLTQVIDGQAPHSGRFCGYCYNPLPKGEPPCPHCGRSSQRWPVVDRVPDEVIAMFRAKVRREGLVVRFTFYGIMTLGIVLIAVVTGLLPFWWQIGTFLLGLGVTYILSANVANLMGDAVGYRWGQRTLTRRWRQFVARRDRGA